MPLLYATTVGATYERFEIERVPGPDPLAPRLDEAAVRLFAEDGDGGRQRFAVVLHDGQRGLV